MKVNRALVAVIAASAVALAACGGGSTASTTTTTSGSSSTTAASGPTPGVTASTIKIGIPYVDLASVAQFTGGLNQGNYPATYQALITAINKQGGINGRQIQATFVAVSPIGSTASSAACTQLTEDDQVFAVTGFFQNDDPVCYTQLHTTPVIGGTMTTQLLANSTAAWFTTIPISNNLEPATIRAAAKAGVFKGKKVAVMSLSNEPSGLTTSVLGALSRAGVKPVATATVVANTSDPQAALQQISGVVSLKFQNAGANVVVLVGQAPQPWGEATASGSYHPRMIATNYNDATAYTSSASAAPAPLAGAVSANVQALTSGTTAIGWADPAMQQCLATVEAAGQKVVPPTVEDRNGNDSYVSVVQACQNLALFKSIATKAGRNLTRATFAQAGDTLGSVSIPGQGTGVFTKASPAGVFPLYLYNWSQPKTSWIPASTASGTVG